VTLPTTAWRALQLPPRPPLSPNDGSTPAGRRNSILRSRCCCGASSPLHGRSSFRDLSGNETHFPRELAEHALAHVVSDKAEPAYRRSDALDLRHELMDVWAGHCERGAKVLSFKRPVRALA
jgi:hypothetical protein